MTAVLEEIASEADAVADEQRELARGIRTMQRRRDRGWSWARILGDEHPGHLLELARDSSRRLLALTARLARTIASGLADEGETRRGIAARLGVTHQRVSAILRADGDTDG
jgi:hypothetical protein